MRTIWRVTSRPASISNDAQRLFNRIERWENWCRLWSEEAARHEALAKEATHKGRALTAAEAYVRAAIYYHYGEHLFAGHAEEWWAAHDSVVRCYAAGALDSDPPLERLTFPYRGVDIPGWLRKPRGSGRPPVAILLPGLDACKEELHAWAAALVARGVAWGLTIDGPGQGETLFHLPTTHEWGHIVGAVIDALERRDNLDARRVGVVGQVLGAIYAPLAAAGDPRIKACPSPIAARLTRAACCRSCLRSIRQLSARALTPAPRTKRSGSPTRSRSWVRQSGSRVRCWW